MQLVSYLVTWLAKYKHFKLLYTHTHTHTHTHKDFVFKSQQ